MDHQHPVIIHAIDTTGPGGAETVFLELAEKLQIPGYRNLAIIKGPGWVEEQLKQRGVDYKIIAPHGFLAIPYYWQLFRLLKQQNAQLIQANLLGSTLTYAIVSLLLKCPLIATLHGRVDVNPNEKFIRIKNAIMRLGVNQLITVSRDLAEYIAQRRLFNKNQIKVIYNGISTNNYQTTPDTQWLEPLHIPHDAILVASIGNVRPAKDYFNLIDAAQVVCEQHPRVHFVIAGHAKSELMAQLTAKITQLNLTGRVHFVGFINNTPGFLKCAQYFWLTSSSEGFSIATLEAMAAGLPVIATRCGGPEEILTPDYDGILVPSKNPQALAEALNELLIAPEKARHISTNATGTVTEKFSLDAMLAQYRSIYLTHLSRATHPATDTRALP